MVNEWCFLRGKIRKKENDEKCFWSSCFYSAVVGGYSSINTTSVVEFQIPSLAFLFRFSVLRFSRFSPFSEQNREVK